MKNQKDLPDEPFDPDSEQPIENEALDFSEGEEPSFMTLSPELEVDEVDISLGDNNESLNLSDDIEPDDLIHEDGALSPHEPSAQLPADEELRVVDEYEIGAGYGLDEAELALIKPLDGERNA